MIIHLISSPRTISTALMYSFAQRADTVVWDEPFYGIYLTHTGFDHPGRDEIIKHMPDSTDHVLNRIAELGKTSHVFIKNIASHFKVLDPGICVNHQNVLLIRDPKRIVISFDKVIHAPTQQDIGIQRQFELYEHLSQLGKPPLVVDSTQIALYPSQQLQSLCDNLGLEFDQKMLSWPAGPKTYDGIWAPYWYSSVQKSTGFHASSNHDPEVPPHLDDLYQEALTYYQFLSEKIENRQHASDL